MNAKRSIGNMAALATALLVCGGAHALDILRAQQNISDTPTGLMIPSASRCLSGPPGKPLQLAEAGERALCDNPKTRARRLGQRESTGRRGQRGARGVSANRVG